MPQSREAEIELVSGSASWTCSLSPGTLSNAVGPSVDEPVEPNASGLGVVVAGQSPLGRAQMTTAVAGIEPDGSRYVTHTNQTTNTNSSARDRISRSQAE